MHNSERMDERRKAIIWREWKKGSPMSLIARVLEKPPATVFSYRLYHGGIEPRVRCRRSIALHLGRSASTISREICRNGGISRYRAAEADKSAWKRATRPKPCRLALNE